MCVVHFVTCLKGQSVAKIQAVTLAIIEVLRLLENVNKSVNQVYVYIINFSEAF